MQHECEPPSVLGAGALAAWLYDLVTPSGKPGRMRFVLDSRGELACDRRIILTTSLQGAAAGSSSVVSRRRISATRACPGRTSARQTERSISLRNTRAKTRGPKKMESALGNPGLRRHWRARANGATSVRTTRARKTGRALSEMLACAGGMGCAANLGLRRLSR